jgi:hypothetical protein
MGVGAGSMPEVAVRRRRRVGVRIGAIVAAQPFRKDAQGQQCDDDADRALGGGLERDRQLAPCQHEGEADGQQREGVARAPEPSHTYSGADPAACHQRGDRHEVVRVRCVTQPEQQGDAEGDEEVEIHGSFRVRIGSPQRREEPGESPGRSSPL